LTEDTFWTVARCQAGAYGDIDEIRDPLRPAVGPAGGEEAGQPLPRPRLRSGGLVSFVVGVHPHPAGSPGTHTGIANRIVDPSELRATALDLANQLGPYTPQVMAAQKGLFATWLNVGLPHGIDTSVEVFAELFADPATVQAIAQYQAAPRT
jgi:hypothetical protein